MRSIFFLLTLIFFCLQNGCGQSNSPKGSKNKYENIGGACEGCEAIYECPTEFEKLGFTCHLPDWNDKGTKLAVNGIVYRQDGSPAKDVIIYIYHTDQNGVYPTKGNEKGWGKRHGYLRGWMKTNEKGEYKFFTLRPAAYPGRSDPAHIHITIKEPDKNEYWIDEFVFDDDPLLTENKKADLLNRGGSGVLKIVDVGNMLKAERNIYLGKNIPGYPE